VPFPLGAKTDDPIMMYMSDVYTTPPSLAGLPAISLPVGFVNSLPVGLQIIADYFGEARLLQATHHYQRGTDWHERSPSGFE
jgi:aspartyl-tRNA(Asn)/glutamyl-tRNA(Gln) amidotransferase subunit A